jgi:hypothetical protein
MSIPLRRNRPQIPYRWLWFTALLLSLTACDIFRTPGTPTKITPSPTLTVVPSSTASPTPTSTVTLTATPTFTPTPFLGGIEGVVYDNVNNDRSPAANAEIRISEKPDMLVDSDSTGAFLLDNIEPATYHVRASNIVGSSVEKVVAVVVGKVTYLEIDILQPVFMSYQYVHATISCDGMPAAGAHIWVAGTDQVFTANDKGEVNLNNVPEKSATIIVSAKSCSTMMSPPEGLSWKINATSVKRPFILPKNPVILAPDVKLEILKPKKFLRPIIIMPTVTPTP